MIRSSQLLAGVLCAETPKTQVLLMAMGANGKQMVSYQWKQMTTVSYKGNPSEPTLEELRFDAAGRVQRISLATPAEKRTGPLRARRTAGVKDTVRQVMQLASRYANPQQLDEAIRKGVIWEREHTLRLQARSVILPGDEMTMLIDGVSHLATRIEFKTQYQGSPVTIAMNYQQTAGRAKHDDADDRSDSGRRHHRLCPVVRLRPCCESNRSLSQNQTKEKNTMKSICLTIFLCFAAAAFAQDINFDYDRTANFSNYKTYQWAALRTGRTTNQLMDQNIKRAVDEQLALKGLKRVESGGDLQIAYQVEIEQEKQYDGFSLGPRWTGSLRVNSSTIDIGKLAVDLFDLENKQLVWHGVAEKALDIKKDPDKNYRSLQKAMAKLFKNYPPGSAK